jgi:hypothetical protein
MKANIIISANEWLHELRPDFKGDQPDFALATAPPPASTGDEAGWLTKTVIQSRDASNQQPCH